MATRERRVPELEGPLYYQLSGSILRSLTS